METIRGVSEETQVRLKSNALLEPPLTCLCALLEGFFLVSLLLCGHSHLDNAHVFKMVLMFDTIAIGK